MRGPLTEGVTGGQSGLDAVLGQDAGHGDADGEDRGLGVLGEAKVRFGALETEL